MSDLDDILLRFRSQTHDLNAERLVRTLRRHTVVAALPADSAANSTTAEHPLFVVPTGMTPGIEVLEVKVVPAANVAQNATQYAQESIWAKSAAGATGPMVAQVSTASGVGSGMGGWSGMMGATLPLNPTQANLQVPPGGSLVHVEQKFGGTGVSLPPRAYAITFMER